MAKCWCCGGPYNMEKPKGERCAECYGASVRFCGECGKCFMHCRCVMPTQYTDPNDYDYQQRIAERNIGAKEDGDKNS